MSDCQAEQGPCIHVFLKTGAFITCLKTRVFCAIIIKLDVDKIIGEKTYSNKLKEYREFIEESRDKIYTAVFDENTHMLTLEEEPKWLFLGSDVIVVDNGDAANPA